VFLTRCGCIHPHHRNDRKSCSTSLDRCYRFVSVLLLFDICTRERSLTRCDVIYLERIDA